jgi:hypothetical protein
VVSIVAWVVVPAVLLALSFGLGALIRHLTGAPLPDGLLAPIGAGAALTLALAGYVIGLRGLLTPLVVAGLAAGGLVLAWRARGARPRPGPAAVAWAATYGLYMAPVVLSGHWTWPGYNFVNDTSIQLLLSEWLPAHGRVAPPEPFVSTPLDALRSYIFGGYPVGSHALLGAVQHLVPVHTEALYHPFVATFGGLGAMALTALARPVVGPWWAAACGVAGMAGNLIYQYALQGNMKEIVTAALLATAAATAAWSVGALRAAAPEHRGRLLMGVAIAMAFPVAGAVNALSTAGGPYVALVVLLWLALLFAYRLVPSVAALAAALAAGGAVLVACALPTLTTLVTFGEVTAQTYASPDRATDLGHLAQPLSVRQTAGIWLNGDYRVPPIGWHATVTDLGVLLVGALALGATVALLWRRIGGPLLFAVPVVAIMLLVTPRVSPYADAKTYMLMAPAIAVLATVGAALLARAWLPAGALAAAVLVLGIAWSDALAYHTIRLAPTDRMAALRDLDRRYEGQGLILFNEPEEFAKNFMKDTKVNVGAEAVTPRQTQTRVTQNASYLWFDLDDLKLEYVEGHPLVAFRRSPSASRPPANYQLDYANEYYEVWRRLPRPRVLEHLPLQAVDRVAAEPDCGEVTAMARRLRPGEQLLAATAPDVVLLDTAQAARSPGWNVLPYRPGRVSTGRPGEARASVAFSRTGTYTAWIAGTFGRRITGLLDGRQIGSAVGVNTIGQWHRIGTVDVRAGRHELRLRRPGGDLKPGDGFSGELGPLALVRDAPRPLVRIGPDEVKSRVCGHTWDWIERVAP